VLRTVAALAGFVLAVVGIAVMSWPLALVAGGACLCVWGLFTDGGE